ncbi:MAG: lysophospholipid acyltransferase family protein [Chloroflexota bacterium]
MALYLVIQVGAFLSRILPRPWRYLIGNVVGDAVYRVWGVKRRIIRSNMATVMRRAENDPVVSRMAAKSMRNHCKYLIEFLELPVLSATDRIVAGMELLGLEHLQNALEQGRGVIMASAHFGTTEVGGLRLKDFTDFHAVYDTFKPAYLDRLIQRKRLEKGIDLIPASNIRAMLRVLKHGGTLVVLFDRPMEDGNGTPVQFFERETRVPSGPAVLAMKTGATILPVYITREPDFTFRTVISPPVTWTPSGDRERDVQGIMQKLMNTLQAAVTARPDQWYMFRPMWPEPAQIDRFSAPDVTSREPAT